MVCIFLLFVIRLTAECSPIFFGNPLSGYDYYTTHDHRSLDHLVRYSCPFHCTNAIFPHRTRTFPPDPTLIQDSTCQPVPPIKSGGRPSLTKAAECRQNQQMPGLDAVLQRIESSKRNEAVFLSGSAPSVGSTSAHTGSKVVRRP